MALLLFLVLAWAAHASIAPGLPPTKAKPTYCPVFYDAESQPPAACVHVPPTGFLRHGPSRVVETAHDKSMLDEAFAAMTTMQDHYYTPETGTWPKAIDWTAAVVGTIFAGMVNTLSRTLDEVDLEEWDRWSASENLISTLFSQLVGSYFGQNALAIRNEAFDDILWVVLGWLEAINLVHMHSSLHYSSVRSSSAAGLGLRDVLQDQLWHGNYWVGAFAHRARIFWELAEKGWDTRLCNGGMNWNPRLRPYKNAVTNELWIASSISMYLDFPGDNNSSPWGGTVPAGIRDPRYLAAAVEGYRWLVNVNLTNAQGLYVDGYHVSNLESGNTKCDQRDEMVYTYNQGVLLTGQRGLWTATGSASYLFDGHNLIQAVIAATGWDLRHDRPVDNLSSLKPGKLPPWRGLGRGGIMEEQCDASGTCSQDSQTFKGIFFHHLVAFCAAIEPITVQPGMTVDVSAFQKVKAAHSQACDGYIGWVRHNAKAAMATRNEEGLFGMWWSAGLLGKTLVTKETDGVPHDAPNVTDYRNEGVPDDGVWAATGQGRLWGPKGHVKTVEMDSFGIGAPQRVMGSTGKNGRIGSAARPVSESYWDDPNDRGRGRTVETQAGGLALLRALAELVYARR